MRLLLTRLRVADDGIDVVGFLSQEELTRELRSAKALVAPSLGGESFGMVLTRAFACALPVVASDIAGLPRRRHAGDRPDGAAWGPGGARGRRSPRCSPTSRAALAMGAAARAAGDRAVLVGRHRTPARAGLRARRRATSGHAAAA